MNRLFLFLPVLSGLTLCFGGDPVIQCNVVSKNPPAKASFEEPAKKWTTNVGLGYLQAQSHEYVLNGPGPGGTTSLLVWDVRDAMTFNFGLSREVTSRLSLFGDAVISLDANDTDMVDFDWLGTTSMITDISQHPDTDLNHYFQVDAGLDYEAIQHSCFDLILRFGFRYTDISMDAYGGSFRYTTNPATGPFFDDVGNFAPNELGISYRQKFPGIYLAPRIEWSLNDRLDLKVGGLAGITVQAEDRDHHWTRNTLFVGDFETTAFYGGMVGFDYQVRPCLSLYLDGHYDVYQQATGDVTISQGATVTSDRNGAATALETWQIRSGVKVAF